MIVVATTLHAYVTDQKDTSEAWLYNAEAIRDSIDDEVVFFAALETDARGLYPFGPLLDRLMAVSGGGVVTVDEYQMGPGADYWTFSFDDHADEITTQNRLRRITMGQNVCSQFAQSVGASHLLFCAADCAPPGDVLPKLLELDHPICGPEIPTYGLHGPEPTRRVPPGIGETVMLQDGSAGTVIEPGLSEDGARLHVQWQHMGRQLSASWARVEHLHDSMLVDAPRFPFPVQEHMASAACVLLAAEVFVACPWRVDVPKGMTDDPCMHVDALRLGYPTYVRKDCVAKHYPEAIGAIETRGHDRKVYR